MRVKFSLSREVSPGVKTFVFEPEEAVEWQAGYFWKLTLPHLNPDDRGVERWFTISAAPFEGHPAITTRIDASPLSSFKQTLLKLEPGAELEAEVPEGDFVVEDQRGRYVFLAGGIGITPFHSILTQFGHQGQMPEIHLLYGSRTAEAPFKFELNALAQQYPQLVIDYLVEPERLSVHTIKQYVPDFRAVTFYVSGPEPMVEALDKELEGLGVTQKHIRNDFFPGYIDL